MLLPTKTHFHKICHHQPLTRESKVTFESGLLKSQFCQKLKTENIAIYLPLRNKELPQHRSCPSAMMAIRSPRKSASSLKTSNRNKEYLAQNLYHYIDCSLEQSWSRKVMANLFSVLTVTIPIQCTWLIYRETYMK